MAKIWPKMAKMKVLRETLKVSPKIGGFMTKIWPKMAKMRVSKNDLYWVNVMKNYSTTYNL